MTWLAQVRHVLVKDVHEAWKLLLLYVAVVAVATGHAVGWTLFSGGVFGGSMLLVLAIGVFLAASVVQADSPTRSDAFWASHPFHPSAVLGAKICFALLLLALALVGQAIGVRAYDVRGLDVLAYLVAPTVFFGALALATMVVAAQTRDLRSFTLAVIAIPVAVSVSSSVVGPVTLPRAMGVALLALGAIAGPVLLAWLYRTRDTRLRTRLAGFAVAASALLTMGADSAALLEDDTPTTMGRVPLALELPRGVRTDGSQLRVNVLVPPLPEGLKLGLEGSVVVVRLRDGSVTRIPLTKSVDDLSGWHTTPHIEGVRWVGTAANGVVRAQVTAPLTRQQRHDIDAGGVTSIAIEGRILVGELRAGATVPLVVGNELTRERRRIRIEEWTHDFGDPSLTLHASSIARRPPRSEPLQWMPGHEVEYALINPIRREALPLQSRGSSSGIDGLVLPGANVRSETATYGASSEAPSREPVRDDAWYGDARLLLVERVSRGSYPVRLELKVP